MKTIRELEDELAVRKNQQYLTEASKRKQVMDKFKKDKDIDIYCASDYCGMDVGEYSFYYGYETQKCPNKEHANEKGRCKYDCDEQEWCFKAGVEGGRQMVIPKSDLWPTQDEDMFVYLLSGIGQFLNKK